jgi:hypothetical protein
MTAQRFIEEESGTYRGHRIHPHNGYYAGDFADVALAAVGPTRPAPSPWR